MRDLLFRDDLMAFRIVAFIAVAAYGWLTTPTATAQHLPVGDALEDYARLLQLTGEGPVASFNVRPVAFQDAFDQPQGEGSNPWPATLARYRSMAGTRDGMLFGLVEPQVQSYWNSSRAYGQNDGALWQGKGATVAVSSGVFGRTGVFSAALRPVLLFNQNAAYDLDPVRPGRQDYSEYAYQGYQHIDMPQRFGAEAFWRLDLGESYVRVDWRGLAAGLSNENLWWGPGIRNAIIMSNHAPGFPHAFIGTSGPQDVYVGDAQFRLIGGMLTESDYFDADPLNDRRYLSGLVVDYSPSFLPGLSVGAARVFTMYTGDLTFGDYFSVLGTVFKKSQATPDNPSGFDETDQLLSIFGRWLMPASGFEIYGEWARGDHSWDVRDFIVQPEHASGGLFGIQKVLGTDRPVRITLELTRLEAPRTIYVRFFGGAGFFYYNGTVKQGYTQRGQVLGAGIGPGSNQQVLAVDRFAPWGKAGVFAHRTVYDEDRQYGREIEADGREVEFAGGARALVFLRSFEVEASLTAARLLNQHLVEGNDVSNLNLGLSFRWRFSGVR